MQETIAFFQHLFESINIYKMLLVYSPDYDIDKLIELLTEKDFPISKYNNENNRIFAIDDFTNTTNLADITCILCTDSCVYTKTRHVLKNRNVENMILFSFK